MCTELCAQEWEEHTALLICNILISIIISHWYVFLPQGIGTSLPLGWAPTVHLCGPSVRYQYEDRDIHHKGLGKKKGSIHLPPSRTPTSIRRVLSYTFFKMVLLGWVGGLVPSVNFIDRERLRRVQIPEEDVLDLAPLKGAGWEGAWDPWRPPPLHIYRKIANCKVGSNSLHRTIVTTDTKCKFRSSQNHLKFP